jgi:hypothetical protein
VADREAGEGQQLLGGVAEHALQLGELAAEHPRDDVQLLVHMLGIRLSKARADGRGDHLGGALRNLGEHVSEEVDPAALDGGAGHGGLDRLSQAKVGVGDDQLHPGQPTGLQRAQERRPERPILAVAHAEAEHLPATITTHPSGHHHGLGDDSSVDPGLAVGGVQKHIGKHLAGQRPVPKRANLGVQLGADPGDLGLGDAAVDAQGTDQVVDLAGGGAMHVGLHHHRQQRPVDAAARLQQRREERARAQLGMRSSTSPALVDSNRARVPLRWAVRVSVRS